MTKSQNRFPAAYILPALGLAAVVWGLPLVYAAFLSLTNATPGSAGDFTGLANYLRALTDPGFGGSVLVGIVFALGVAGLNVGVGFGIALALRAHSGARTISQTALLLPWVLSELAVALIWIGFCHESNGLLNMALQGLGLPRLLYRSSATAAMGVLWMASLWRGLAFSAMLQMAGLASLPRTLLSAAKVDGARFPQIFHSIIWPHQSRLVAVNLLLVFLYSFIAFALPFALTGGGPLGATEFVSLYAYRTAFSGDFELGYAAAQGVVVLLSYAVFMMLLLRLRRRAT